MYCDDSGEVTGREYTVGTIPKVGLETGRFYQSEPSDEILNCEAEGILGSTANIVGAVQVNEVLKKILNIGKD